MKGVNEDIEVGAVPRGSPPTAGNLALIRVSERHQPDGETLDRIDQKRSWLCGGDALALLTPYPHVLAQARSNPT